jgi:hypothetical protein
MCCLRCTHDALPGIGQLLGYFFERLFDLPYAMASRAASALAGDAGVFVAGRPSGTQVLRPGVDLGAYFFTFSRRGFSSQFVRRPPRGIFSGRIIQWSAHHWARSAAQ